MLLSKDPCLLKTPIPWFFSDNPTGQSKSIKNFPLTFLKANCSNIYSKIIYYTVHSFEGHYVLFDYCLIREKIFFIVYIVIRHSNTCFRNLRRQPVG